MQTETLQILIFLTKASSVLCRGAAFLRQKGQGNVNRCSGYRPVWFWARFLTQNSGFADVFVGKKKASVHIICTTSFKQAADVSRKPGAPWLLSSPPTSAPTPPVWMTPVEAQQQRYQHRHGLNPTAVSFGNLLNHCRRNLSPRLLSTAWVMSLECSARIKFPQKWDLTLCHVTKGKKKKKNPVWVETNPLCWCSSGFWVHYVAEIMEWNFIRKWIKVVALLWCCGAFYASADQYLFTTWWRKKKIRIGRGGGRAEFSNQMPWSKAV